MMVIDTEHRIQFCQRHRHQPVWKNRYNGELLKRRLEDLGVDDHGLAFSVLEKGECLEVEIRAHDRIWIKKGIPLFSTPAAAPAVAGTGWPLDAVRRAADRE